MKEGLVKDPEVQILADQLAQASQIIAARNYEVIHPDASEQVEHAGYRARRGRRYIDNKKIGIFGLPRGRGYVSRRKSTKDEKKG